MGLLSLLRKNINNTGKEVDELLKRVLPLNDPDLVGLFVEKKEIDLSQHLEGSIAELVQKSPQELDALLEGKDSAEMENMEKLGDLFAAIAQKKDWEQREIYREAALNIYNYITEKTATFSFTRSSKISQLQS